MIKFMILPHAAKWSTDFFKLTNQNVCTGAPAWANRSELPTKAYKRTKSEPTNQISTFDQLMGQNSHVKAQFDLYLRNIKLAFFLLIFSYYINTSGNWKKREIVRNQ